MTASVTPAPNTPMPNTPSAWSRFISVVTPSRGEVLYSLKCFAAAMLALYLALRIGLLRPFWSVMTTYIVASPFSGMVRSKAVYRVCGTILGSAMTVFLVPHLVNSPELLSVALAGWVGLCLAVSLLDRTPRSYVFMLAGYTAALIGFPAVSDPASIFDVAVSRVEEISLGIVCATLVHSLVFPQSLAPVLLSRVDRAMGDAQRWIAAVMLGAGVQGQRQGAQEAGVASQDFKARRTLAGDITELRLMSTHLPFDTSHLRWTSGALHALHDRLALIMPALSAVEDRLAALRALAGESDASGAGAKAETVDAFTCLPVKWRQVVQDIAQWVQAARVGSPDATAELAPVQKIRTVLAELTPEIGRDMDWRQMLLLNLAARLNALIDACEQCFDLRQHIHEMQDGAGASSKAAFGSAYKTSQFYHFTILHRDVGMALRSGFAAMIAIGACCLFWIVTSWPAGAASAMMAAVFCCFFATQDDPVPSIRGFIHYTLLSIPFSALYLLGVLPAVHNFESLVLVLAPFFIVLGMFAGRPTTGPQVMPVLIGVFGMLTIQDTGSSDLVAFLNGMTAQIIGMLSAALFTKLLRSVSADWTASRLLRMGWAELAEFAQLENLDKSRKTSLTTSTSSAVIVASARMLDRISLLTPRLALANLQQDHSADMALGDLRIGLNMAHLRTMQTQMEQTGLSIDALMHNLSLHFQRQPAIASVSCPELLGDIDQLLRESCRRCDGKSAQWMQHVVAALVSLRRDLFPHAPATIPGLPESVPSQAEKKQSANQSVNQSTRQNARQNTNQAPIFEESP